MGGSAKRLALVPRETAKSALRSYGLLTAGLRAGPDFVVIGAKRGGTTSFYNYLLEHPKIQPLFPGRQRIKGVHFFDSGYARGERWYRSHFPLAIGSRHLARPWISGPVTGEASPYYLFHPLAAERLARHCPDVRLLVVLRDPVERAYSHYKERVRNGGEALSFEAAIEAEAGRISGEASRIVAEPGYLSYEHENHSYLAQGRYAEMLPRWFELFGAERFFIAASEDFYADPERVTNDAWSFLGLPLAQLTSRKRFNYHPAPDLSQETRRRLSEAFAEHNLALERLLGRELPWSHRVDEPGNLAARQP